MARQPIEKMSIARIYPLLLAKAVKKGRTQAEVDAVIGWLTGYSPDDLAGMQENGPDLATFFAEAPRMNPARELITGVVCGVRVEDITDPTLREIRYMDKLIDELAKGKKLEKIMRQG